MARQCTVEQYGAPRICFAVHTGIPLRSLKVSSGLGNMPGRGGLAMSNSDACGFFCVPPSKQLDRDDYKRVRRRR